jgi:flavin reductase (DIM6/NTAB) family NADH-FMN oxidoreductase RutF/rubredoxin
MAKPWQLMNHEAFYGITYGLYVVSSTNGSQSNGYVANTVFQVTAKPARFAIACNKDNFTCGLISQSQVFAISILQQDTKAELIGLFGYKSGRTLNKYASVRHRTGQTGAPILLEDTLAWFECRVVQTIDVGTHLLFVGEVVDGDVTDTSQPPLTYAYYREVKKGKAPKNAPTYIEPAKSNAPDNAPLPSGKYVCAVCGHVYDPAVGEPDARIPAGTRFEDIPENWVCTVCGAAKSDFVKQS